jgi:DNA-binding GntR family transcriptional regulator
VREALRQLECEGLVTLRPNRGAVVTSHSLDEVMEMLEIRIALECHALEIAIDRRRLRARGGYSEIL